MIRIGDLQSCGREPLMNERKLYVFVFTWIIPFDKHPWISCRRWSLKQTLHQIVLKLLRKVFLFCKEVCMYVSNGGKPEAMFQFKQNYTFELKPYVSFPKCYMFSANVVCFMHYINRIRSRYNVMCNKLLFLKTKQQKERRNRIKVTD